MCHIIDIHYEKIMLITTLSSYNLVLLYIF
jgi:hypothetical protein